MVVRMRSTRAHRDNRRSHFALDEARSSKCAHCGALHRRHSACMACGYYRGSMVIDVKAAIDRKVTRKAKRETAGARA